MNKFLWNLFGIKEDDIPDPTRRGFLKLLGGAAVTGVVAPKYFLAPTGGWSQRIVETPSSFMFMESTARGSNDWVVSCLTDSVFKMSPMFVGALKPIRMPKRGLIL